jgi:hypothetical protein
MTRKVQSVNEMLIEFNKQRGIQSACGEVGITYRVDGKKLFINSR